MRLDRRRARVARMVTDFDSSVNMVRAVGRFLRGKDYPALSLGPGSASLADAAAALPAGVRRWMFTATGLQQGIPLHRVGQVNAEDMAHWVTEQYPAETYPAVIVGAASGAVVFLAAALRAPFLPQTTLVSLRDRATHPDDPVSAMHAVAPLAQRVADYLAAEGSPWRRWTPPEPDARRPDAEWGFDPALRQDVERVARRRGYRLCRLAGQEPQDYSGFVADVYRAWYRRRGMPGNRLLCQCYVQWDPLWTLRLGAVPFWLRFNMDESCELLERYLDAAEPYDHIHVNLFSQGLHSPGLIPVEQWRDLAATRARVRGEVIGVAERAYPADTGSTLRYQPAFRALPPRYSLPPPLDVEEIDWNREPMADVREWPPSDGMCVVVAPAG